MKKKKWYGILFAAYVLFMYVMGVYDLFMMLGHDHGYYASHGYGQEVVIYFTNYPIGFLVFWVINLVCGVLSPILYLFNKKRCVEITFLSFFADAFLMTMTSIFRNRIGVLGWNIFAFDLFILLLTLCFAIFCRQARESNGQK